MLSDITPPQLFPEIIDLILDYFDPSNSDDGAVLRQFSQASKHFSYKAQTMLFREIRLIDDEVLQSLYHDNAPASISHRCRRLSLILDKKPYLLSAIRVLIITLGFTNKWISNDSDFIDMMTRLARPESGFNVLHLRAIVDDVKIADNREFERNVFFPFIAPRLTSLHVHLLTNVPLALIAESPNLVNLSLSCSKIERISSVPPKISDTPTPSIRTLHVKDSRQMLSVLTSHPALSPSFADFSRLVEYTDGITYTEDVNGIHLLLVEAKSSLQKLKITPTSDKGSFQDIANSTSPEYYFSAIRSLNLSQQQNLHTIHISLVFGDHHSALVASLATSLGTISAPTTNLRELELTFHLRPDSQHTLAALSSADWVSLRKQVNRIAGLGGDDDWTSTSTAMSTSSFRFVLNFCIGYIPLGINSPDHDLVAIKKSLEGRVEYIHQSIFQATAEHPNLSIEVFCL